MAEDDALPVALVMHPDEVPCTPTETWDKAFATAKAMDSAAVSESAMQGQDEHLAKALAMAVEIVDWASDTATALAFAEQSAS